VGKDKTQIPITHVEKLNFDYALKGKNLPWKPELVFDDGRQTFIKFPEAIGATELPVLFVVTKETDTQIVNYRKKGPFFIVDRLMEKGVLKLGSKERIEIIKNGS
jgi:type IV secretion system protein VirB9